MSKNFEEQFAGKIDSLTKLANLIKILIVSAFGIGAWVATLEYRQREADAYSKKVDAEILKNETQIASFNLWKERTEANRFDTKMAAELANTLNTRANIQELKTQKLEIGQQEIQKSLSRIESKLGTK